MRLTKDWAARIIRHVGNYNEVFERNLGTDSKLGIPRGLNQLWNAGGIAGLNGDPRHPELPPLRAFGDQAGFQAGLHAAIPSLAALFARITTGQGDHIEVSTQEEFRSFYGMTMAKAPWVPGVTLDHIGERYIAQRQQLARIFRDFHHVGLLDDSLASIRVPVLVMWGAKDQLVHVSAAAKWAAGIPGARRVIYDDLGHMPMVEDPSRSAHDVTTFIAQLPEKK